MSKKNYSSKKILSASSFLENSAEESFAYSEFAKDVVADSTKIYQSDKNETLEDGSENESGDIENLASVSDAISFWSYIKKREVELGLRDDSRIIQKSDRNVIKQVTTFVPESSNSRYFTPSINSEQDSRSVDGSSTFFTPDTSLESFRLKKMVSSETCQTTINFVPIRRKREMFFDNSTICDNSDVYEDAESSLCKEPLESSVKISEKMPDISWHSRNATLDTINEEDVSRQSLDESSEISEFKGNKTTMDTGSSTDTSSNWSKTEKEIQWNETSVLYNLQTSRTYESEVQIMDETVNLTTQNENIDEITKVIESKEVSQAYIQQSKDNTTLSSIVKSKNNTTLFEDSVDNIEVSPMVVHKIDSSSDSEIEIPKSQKTKKLRRVSIQSSFEEDKTTFAEKAKKSPNLNKFPLHDGLDYRHVNVRRKKVLPKPIEQETSSDSENNDLNMSHGYGEQIDSDCSKKDTKRHEKLNTDSRTFSGMNVSHVFEENEDASSSSEAEIEVKKGNNLISKFKSLLNVSLSRKKKSNLFDFDNINLESAREFMDYLNDDFDCARPKNVERFFIQHGFSSRGLELSKICYDIFNTFCFNNQLPKVEINWNKRLQRTAGTTCHNTKNNTCEIKLSSKVCDRPDRIRDTLIHEMVHVANFLIDKDPKANHGPLFKKWGVTCSIMFPELPKIGTSHSYDIDAKYVYICVGCNQTIKRHRTSAIIPKRRCGICKERFQLYIDGIKA